jgi:flagellar biosynthesis chaperone FliJ
MSARKFVFTLQPLLDRRKVLESAALRAVALSRHAYAGATRELERLDDAIRAAGSPPVQNAQLLQLLSQSAEAQARAVAEGFAALEIAQRESVSASTARKVIETLKQRRREAFVAERRRAEQSELDDANGQPRRSLP